MYNIDLNPSLTEDEINYIANYIIYYSQFTEKSIKSINNTSYEPKVFVGKYEFQSSAKSKKLKPLKNFYENFFINIMKNDNVNWIETEQAYFYPIDNKDSFLEAIKLFYDIVLINDPLDLTICSNLYYNDYETREFSTIGDLLHKVKREGDNRFKQTLFKEINLIIEFFNFSIYGNNNIIIPLHSSTDIVSKTAQMIAKKTQWELQEIEQQPSTSIKNLSKRFDKLKKLNENVILSDEANNNNKNVLLVDDNYQSGSSINFYSKILKKYYNVNKVFSFCLTKTAASFNPESGGHYE